MYNQSRGKQNQCLSARSCEAVQGHSIPTTSKHDRSSCPINCVHRVHKTVYSDSFKNHYCLL